MILTRVGPRGIAVALSAAIAIAACSSEPSSDPDQTAATTTAPVTTVPISDRQLAIGVMLPPAATLLRDPITNGVGAAVDQINAAGGVFGRRVRLVKADEGDTVTSGADAAQSLIADHVDAIIGPASSTIALSILSGIVSNDVVTCSPTAAAMGLDQFPDDGLFFRTVPSDSMQAEAIAQVAEGTGVQSVVVAYVDDGFGRPYAAAVSDALENVSIDVADTIGFASGDIDPGDSVRRVIDSNAPVLVLLAGSTDGTHFLEALNDADAPTFTNIIVNDAFRSADAAQRLAALPTRIRKPILGVAPQAEADDPEMPFDTAGPFASQAFDCVTLIALAASRADSDIGGEIAEALPSVSAGGQTCRTYADCSALATLSIDYNGPSGLTEIGSSGDPSRARFITFSFDDDGHDQRFSTFNVDD